MTNRIVAIGCLISLAVLAPAPGAAQVDIVALKNDESPEASFFYRKFQRPAVGDAASDQVAFIAKAFGGGVGSIRGIFRDSPGSAGSTIVLKNDLGPDSRLFRRFGNPTANASGDVAFSARLSGGAQGVFRSGPSLVAFVGDTVAGVTGQLKAFQHANIVDGGDVVFHATVSGAATVAGVSVDEGIFRCTGGDGNCSSGTGTLEAVVVKNDPVTDRPGREICRFLALRASTFGVAFVAESKEDCSDGSEPLRRGVFRLPFGSTNVVTVGLEGEECEPDPTPGSGTIYQLIISEPDIASDGTVVFKARTTGLLVNTNLYLCDSGICPAAPAESAVLEGTIDPDGNVFAKFGPPVVSDAGDVAFKAEARGVDKVRGVYLLRAGGSLETLVLNDDPAPGVLPAASFTRFREGLDMSPAGLLTFRGKVRADVAPRKSRPGVFVTDTSSPSGAFLDPAPGLFD